MDAPCLPLHHDSPKNALTVDSDKVMGYIRTGKYVMIIMDVQ